MKRIAIGMSGGIDSSIAAYLLKKEGYDVIGFTLRLWEESSRCCDRKDIYDAQIFSKKIGIKHYIIDLRDIFKKKVVDYFIEEYIKGRTPNPCVICNQYIKFNYIFNNNMGFEFDYIATGHYVSIKKENGKFFLARAKDKKKSQEYFLARLKKEYLKKIIFPLSNLTKEEVKSIAKDIGFNFHKKESQEICFLKKGEKHYDFILKRIDNNNFKGNIVEIDGNVLGRHNCYFKYTIGQRQGLGISDATPYYVVKIDSVNKNVIVGKKEDVFKSKFLISQVYWYKNPSSNIIKDIKVRIRYNHPGENAILKVLPGKKAEINFVSPQHAITPGQLAVIYENEKVIGSGWITDVYI